MREPRAAATACASAASSSGAPRPGVRAQRGEGVGRDAQRRCGRRSGTPDRWRRRRATRGPRRARAARGTRADAAMSLRTSAAGRSHSDGSRGSVTITRTSTAYAVSSPSRRADAPLEGARQRGEPLVPEGGRVLDQQRRARRALQPARHRGRTPRVAEQRRQHRARVDPRPVEHHEPAPRARTLRVQPTRGRARPTRPAPPRARRRAVRGRERVERRLQAPAWPGRTRSTASSAGRARPPRSTRPPARPPAPARTPPRRAAPLRRPPAAAPRRRARAERSAARMRSSAPSTVTSHRLEADSSSKLAGVAAVASRDDHRAEELLGVAQRQRREGLVAVEGVDHRAQLGPPHEVGAQRVGEHHRRAGAQPRHEHLLGLDGERAARRPSPPRRPAAPARRRAPRTPPGRGGCAPPRAAGRAPRRRARRALGAREAALDAVAGVEQATAVGGRSQRSMHGQHEGRPRRARRPSRSAARRGRRPAPPPPRRSPRPRRGCAARRGRACAAEASEWPTTRPEDVRRDPEGPGEQGAVADAREAARERGEAEGRDAEGGVDPARALDRASPGAGAPRRWSSARDRGGRRRRARGRRGTSGRRRATGRALPTTATKRPGSAARRSDSVRIGCAKASTVERPSSSPDARACTMRRPRVGGRKPATTVATERAPRAAATDDGLGLRAVTGLASRRGARALSTATASVPRPRGGRPGAPSRYHAATATKRTERGELGPGDR